MQRLGFILFILILPVIIFIAMKLLFSENLFSVDLNFRTIFILIFISPMLEEIVFRGLLQEWLPQILPNKIISIILLNILFAALHYNVNNQFIYLLAIFFCGIIYSAVKILYKKNIFPILLHSYYNACFIIAMLLLRP